MKRTTLTITLILIVLQFFSQEIILLHTNDLHSKLNGYSPELEYTPFKQDNDMTMGGFARIAGIIEKEKSDNPDDIVLAIDAGDFLMGSLFHPLEKDSGFQLQLMEKMGYDYLSIGNHEFDYGPEMLAQIIEHAVTNKTIPSLLLSNVEFDAKDTRDDKLEVSYKNGIIKEYIIHEEKGIKIAFIGIMGYDARDVQPFLPPVSITDPIKTTKKLSKSLIKEKEVDIVIVLSHSGVAKGKKGEWAGEDVKLAKKSTPYVTAIISGHTHTKLDQPVIESSIPIVQTGSGGKYVGKLVFTKTDNQIIFKSHELIPVDDSQPAIKEIQNLIDTQKEAVETQLLSPFNIKYDDAVVETQFNMECHEDGNLGESTLGPLLAEAIYEYVNDAGIKSDMSIIAAGVIRDQLRVGKHGIQNISDLFRITSLGEGEDDVPGYPIAQVYVTGKELKNVIEILLMTQSSSTAAYCYFGGVKIYADMSNGFLKKVSKIEIKDENGNWQTVGFDKSPDKLYSVSANAYMLSFLGMIKEKSFGLVNVKPKNSNGEIVKDMKNQYLDFDTKKAGVQEGKEWLAFLHFVSKFPDTNGNGIPDIPEEYRTRFNPVYTPVIEED
jgi:5'-nucleotidase / UDP-sugar diphosphatase